MIGKIDCSHAFVSHLIVIPDIYVQRIVCMMLINFQEKEKKKSLFCETATSTSVLKTFHSCS